jgi:hypothetical protein
MRPFILNPLFAFAVNPSGRTARKPASAMGLCFKVLIHQEMEEAYRALTDFHAERRSVHGSWLSRECAFR